MLKLRQTLRRDWLNAPEVLLPNVAVEPIGADHGRADAGKFGDGQQLRPLIVPQGLRGAVHQFADEMQGNVYLLQFFA